MNCNCCICNTLLYTTEYGRLMYIVYEKLDVKLADLGTHAWAYHPNLSLENLSIALESQSMQSKYPILHKFLQNVWHLPIVYKNVRLIFVYCIIFASGACSEGNSIHSRHLQTFKVSSQSIQSSIRSQGSFKHNNSKLSSSVTRFTFCIISVLHTSSLLYISAHSSGDVQMMLDGLNKAWGLCKSLLKVNCMFK